MSYRKNLNISIAKLILSHNIRKGIYNVKGEMKSVFSESIKEILKRTISRGFCATGKTSCRNFFDFRMWETSVDCCSGNTPVAVQE